MKPVRAVDLFCGAGGFSTGLLRVGDRRGRSIDLLAINHWDDAINTHSLNHPGVRHLQEDLAVVDPRRAVPGGKLDLLLASPECTSHSYSRGGRPISEQSRATAYHPLKWADQLLIDAMVIENVPALRAWGPTNRRGRPIPSRKGETYRQWLDMIRAMGYTVDTRVLNSADYGGATTRPRLFIIALKGNRTIRWPEPTHAPSGSLLPGRQPWRGAKEIIDPALQGRSIFNRTKPLARKTLERILTGGDRYWPALRPYLTILRQHMGARSLELPAPTIAAGGQHIGLVEPVLVNVAHGDNPPGSGRGNGGRTRSALDPMGSLTGSRELGLADAFLLGSGGAWDNRPQSLEEPLRGVMPSASKALAQAFLIGQQSNAAPRSVDQPAPTVATAGRIAHVEPAVVIVNRTNNRPHSVEEPVPVLNTGGHIGLAEASISLVEPILTDGHEEASAGPAFIVAFNGERPGQTPRVHSIEQPMPVVPGSRTKGLAEGLVVKYNSNGHARLADHPLGTLTAKPRYGLVTPHGIQIGDHLYLDIRFRMLRVHELAGAMGFPRGYQFTGTIDDQIKQVGNAVSVEVAEALCWAVLA